MDMTAPESDVHTGASVQRSAPDRVAIVVCVFAADAAQCQEMRGGALDGAAAVPSTAAWIVSAAERCSASDVRARAWSKSLRA
jgi:hypothetical protein